MALFIILQVSNGVVLKKGEMEIYFTNIETVRK